MTMKQLNAKTARRAGKANRRRPRAHDGRLGRSGRVRPDLAAGGGARARNRRKRG